MVASSTSMNTVSFRKVTIARRRWVLSRFIHNELAVFDKYLG